MSESERPKCSGVTRAGVRCRRPSMHGSQTCWHHDPQRIRDRARAAASGSKRIDLATARKALEDEDRGPTVAERVRDFALAVMEGEIKREVPTAKGELVEAPPKWTDSLVAGRLALAADALCDAGQSEGMTEDERRARLRAMLNG